MLRSVDPAPSFLVLRYLSTSTWSGEKPLRQALLPAGKTAAAARRHAVVHGGQADCLAVVLGGQADCLFRPTCGPREAAPQTVVVHDIGPPAGIAWIGDLCRRKGPHLVECSAIAVLKFSMMFERGARSFVSHWALQIAKLVLLSPLGLCVCCSLLERSS